MVQLNFVAYHLAAGEQFGQTNTLMFYMADLSNLY